MMNKKLTELTPEEIESLIAKNNYYIASNTERSKFERAEELKKHNEVLENRLVQITEK